MSAPENLASPLDKLVSLHPAQVGNFALSSNVVRTSVTSAGEALVLLPERGVMPVFWAADGLAELESSTVRGGTIQLPVGSYDFRTPDGHNKQGTLTQSHKKAIVARHHDAITEANRLILVDEVQKGGTITELADIILKVRGRDNNRLYVVAAQDSRKKVSDEAKKEQYARLAAGNMPGVSATVVPMPLIATDSSVLLNKLWYDGSTRVPTEHTPHISIVSNTEAELIFRVLGTASRNRDMLHDTELLDGAVFNLPMQERTAKRVEEWRERFISFLKSKIA